MCAGVWMEGRKEGGGNRGGEEGLGRKWRMDEKRTKLPAAFDARLFTTQF